jgi:hypothetical protein
MAGGFWPCATDILVKENRIALARMATIARFRSANGHDLRDYCNPEGSQPEWLTLFLQQSDECDLLSCGQHVHSRDRDSATVAAHLSDLVPEKSHEEVTPSRQIHGLEISRPRG